MRIDSIEMTNWKCFDHKKVTFDRLTLLNWKNGEGKTSLIQAIVLCLFNKRPDNLDFASLVDISKQSKLILKFTHKANTYIVEREIGKTSANRLYKNEELISRTAKETKEVLDKIISENVLTSLWGYEPLSVSNVLSTNYLQNLLDDAFAESLEVKQKFLDRRSYSRQRKNELESKIKNQNVTKDDISKLKSELDDIEAKIKEKAFISDDEVVKAKKAEQDYEEYVKIKKQLDDCEVYTYDRDTCKKLMQYGKTEEEWNNYFEDIKKQLEVEKSKTKGSPLIKYPKSTIDSLIKESESNGNKCILCGGKFVRPEIDYDIADNSKIQRLEQLLKTKEEENWNYQKLIASMKYWHFKKLFDNVSYVENYDYKSVLNNYDKDTNDLYEKYDDKKREFESLNTDFSKISELLEARQQYDTSKKCIDIVEEYMNCVKAFYANNIVKTATTRLNDINPRYTKIFIENGVYKVKLWDKDFTKESILAVQSLSKGEKTIVALSLIIVIRDMFIKDLPLIMDESFSNLDANNVESIKRLINEDNNQWIIVSHDERLVS